MKPVDQTTFGGCDAPLAERGDCLSACLASIMELPLVCVPRFCELPSDDDWLGAINRWTNTHGLFYLEANLDEEPYTEYVPYSGYHVLNGLGPRGHQHSTVARARQLVHDPHWSRDFLTPHTEENPWSRGFLVPLDPVRP